MTVPKDPLPPVDAAYLKVADEIGARHKASAHALLSLRPGECVLDAGCGPGIDTLKFASIVGVKGTVTGIDHNPAMVDEAMRRSQAMGITSELVHLVAKINDLPFTPDSFDVVHSERVFVHLENPQEALHELIRVTKPGGRILITEPDGGSRSTDTSEIETERRLANFWAENRMNGYSGRRLFGMFVRAGLQNIQLEVTAQYLTNLELARFYARADLDEAKALEKGILTHTELARYRKSLEDADALGAFFYTNNMISVLGFKPKRE